MKITASGSKPSWQIDGLTMEKVRDFIFLGSKSLQMVTSALKLRYLLLGRKAMTNLDSILKSTDITLLTNVHIVKAMVFPVAIHRCESWAIKKGEHWRTDAFELWCLRRLLRILWTARRSNQSILKEINPEYLLEGLMLKLRLQNFGPLCKDLTYWKRLWCWERLRAGGDKNRRWDGWMASLTQWTWIWANSGKEWRTQEPGPCSPWGCRVGHDFITEQ